MDKKPKLRLPEKIELRVEFLLQSGACKVSGPLNLKIPCIVALSEAIKVVASHVPPIIQPAVIAPNAGSIPVTSNGGSIH